MFEGSEEIKIGKTQIFQKNITKDDTAFKYGTGVHKNLLSTPILVAFMIEATTKMIDPILPKWFVTVGKNISVEHHAPTAVGVTVTVEAVLTGMSGNHLTFSIKVYDELGIVAAGIHERYIVNYDHFMNNVEKRCDFFSVEKLRVDL